MSEDSSIDKDGTSSDDNNDSGAADPSQPDELSVAVQAAVKDAVASDCIDGGNGCGGSVSYIHVYQHAADCTGGDHQGSHDASCGGAAFSSGTKRKADVELEIPSLGSVLGRVQDVLGRMRSVLPGENGSGDSDPTAETSKKHQEAGEAAQECPGQKDRSAEAFSPDESPTGDPVWEDIVPEPAPQRRIWHGLSGIAVLTFGVVAPLLMTVMGMASCPKRITLVLLNHPVETMIELVLLLAIPLINLRVWKSICKNDVRFTVRSGLTLGMTIAMAMAVGCLSFAAIPAGYHELQQYTGTNFATGFFFMGVLSLAAALTGLYLTNQARLTREFSSSRARVVAYTAVGLICGLLVFVSCEARSWTVRFAEKLALSADHDEKVRGLSLLRKLDTEKELRMDCSDSRAAGIAGLFIPVKRSQLPQLYFNVTGKAFQDENSKDFSSMPDWYLKRHVVGAPVKGLSLIRSAFNGKVSPASLTSTVNWTFVFRNDTSTEQEARAELALPPGAVINGLTVWKDGEPVNAGFFASSNEDNANWINGGSTTPAIIRDLGKGRYLFHCYPVTQDEQLKVSIRVIVPLRLEALDKTSLTLPRFLAANFDFDGENSLMLESPGKLSSRSENISLSRDAAGTYVLTGLLDESQLDHTPLVVTASRKPSLSPLAAPDYIYAWIEREDIKKEEARKKAEEEAQRRYEESVAPQEPRVVVTIDGSRGVKEQIEGLKSLLHKKQKKKTAKKKEEKLKPKWIVRNIKEVVTESPKQLIIVLDGSKDMATHRNQIKKALKAIPNSMNVFLSVASNEEKHLSAPTKLSEAIKHLDTVSFVGGQDNLKTVVKAAEKASATDGGAVLWIHGQQPALSQEIYIMSPFGFRPTFFELSLDDGVTDTVEYFKNHGEVGPFMPIQTTTNVSSDLEEFFNSWLSGRKTYQVSYELREKKPDMAVEADERTQREMRTMHAQSLVYDKIKTNKASRASLLAVAYRLVSPVSCASMIKQSGQPMLDFYEASSIEGDIAQGASPILQGATNGTIGPQGPDATAIMGVNTAGTVRVNNLANLEALLSLASNLIELAGMLAGGLMILHGFLIRQAVTSVFGVRARLSPGVRIAIGAAIIVAALMVPGLVNWFVASARDANLFA